MKLTIQRQRFLLLGAALGFLAVLFGAFGAHALKGNLSVAAMSQYQTAVQYHFYHVGAIFFAALSGEHAARPQWLTRALLGFVIGVVLFSGSLYLLALSGSTVFALVTPMGGLVLLFSWASLALAFLSKK